MSSSPLSGHAPSPSPSTINPDQKYPLGPHAPTDASHHHHGQGMIIGSSIAIALVLFITCSRLWARKFRSRALGADDVVMVPAAIGCIMYLALNIVSESDGCLGQHLEDCTDDQVDRFIRLLRANLPMFYFTVFCVKISITLANLRIAGLTSMKWMYAHWAYLGILSCLMPVCVFLTTFSCSPTAASVSSQHADKMTNPTSAICLNEAAVAHFTRIAHIVTDCLLLPVPIIIIRRLKMPLTRKLRLMFVFCIGLISSVASIVRIILSERVTTDLTYDYYELYAWDVVDISFATIVASLPPLNGLFDLALLKLKTWGSVSAARLAGKFRAIGHGSRASQTYDDSQLARKESNETVTPDVTDDGRFSDTFHSYRESFPVRDEEEEEEEDDEYVEHGEHSLEANSPPSRKASLS